MHRSRPVRAVLAVALGAAACVLLAVAVRAELADVYLKSGVRLRGDVTVTDTEIALRNDAGEVRFPRDEVDRIVPVDAPASQPVTRPVATSAPAATAPTEEPVESAGEGVDEPDRPGGLPRAPLLSARDMQRLKLLELAIEPPAEDLRIRFPQKGGERELIRDVLRELARRPDYDEAWGETLRSGKLPDKLQLIARTTGAQFADRIEVTGDPAAFANFRRKVLPAVLRGCARSGCHASPGAAVFRLPGGSQQTEAFAYTTFVLLDELKTARGRVIDRADPEGSLLLSYMLPLSDPLRAHPPLADGKRIAPVFRTVRDPLYVGIVHWINSLRSPHPAYDLDYFRAAGEAAGGASRPAAASQPATTQPAGREDDGD